MRVHHGAFCADSALLPAFCGAALAQRALGGTATQQRAACAARITFATHAVPRLAAFARITPRAASRTRAMRSGNLGKNNGWRRPSGSGKRNGGRRKMKISMSKTSSQREERRGDCGVINQAAIIEAA